MTTTDKPPIHTPRPPRSGKYLESQFLQLRCSECRHLFEAETPVNVDIAIWGKALKRLACPACGSARLLMGQGRTREEDAAFPHGGTEAERVAMWLDNGERGTSSEAILERLSGKPQEHRDIPRDLSDLNRCLLLLARIPAWRDRMGEMAEVSPDWARLAAAWDELITTYYEEEGFWLDGKPAPRSRAILDRVNQR